MEIAHPPSTVWAALTTAEGLSAWFGDEATIDLRPGGSARMSWTNGVTTDMRVERVEEPAVFGFTWQIYGLPKDDPRRASSRGSGPLRSSRPQMTAPMAKMAVAHQNTVV